MLLTAAGGCSSWQWPTEQTVIRVARVLTLERVLECSCRLAWVPCAMGGVCAVLWHVTAWPSTPQHGAVGAWAKQFKCSRSAKCWVLFTHFCVGARRCLTGAVVLQHGVARWKEFGRITRISSARQRAQPADNHSVPCSLGLALLGLRCVADPAWGVSWVWAGCTRL